MKKSRVSSIDVAKAAGVSQSTVSRVINNRDIDMIGEETRQRVLRTAEALNYSPNPFAQALRGSRTNLLGVIVREIADPFFAKLISELSIQARTKGFHLVLGHAGSDPLEALELNAYLGMRHTDGIFLLGDLQGDEEPLFDVIGKNQEVIALCRGHSPDQIHTINTDNKEGIKMIMDHLTSLGHKKIGFIDGGWLGDIRERLDSYRDYLNINGIPFNPKWVQNCKNTAEGGYLAANKFIGLDDLPTAILASDDEIAIGAMSALSAHGKNIPEDISITGFDNIQISKYSNPSLTTIEQPIEEMCAIAIEIMIDTLEERKSEFSVKTTLVKPKLIIRESTGQPKI